jgi:hypothetical protein
VNLSLPLRCKAPSARLVRSILESATGLIENKVADSSQPFETIAQSWN